MTMESAKSRRIIVLAACRHTMSASNFYDSGRWLPQFVGKLGVHLMHALWIFYVCFGSMEMWYLYEHPSSAMVVAQVLSTIQMLLMYHSLLARKPLIRETINRLQQIVDDRCANTVDSYNIHRQSEAKYHRITVGFIKGSVGSVAVLALPIGISPILYLLVGFPGRQNWLFPTGLRSPFDQHTFAGFYLTWFIVAPGIAFYFVVFTAVMSFFIGICVNVSAMVRDMTLSVRALNARMLATNADAVDSSINRMFAESVKFHNDIIQIGENVRDIMDGVLFYQMVCCTTLIAFGLAAFERNSGQMSIDLLISMSSLCAQLFSAFVYCTFADSITTNLASVADILYDALWYRQIFCSQKYLVLSMQRAQRPFRLHGYRICDCSLETFSKVIRGAVSYYLFLRKLK